MAMGKRKRRAHQSTIWIATSDLPRTAAHPFLSQHSFEVGGSG